MKKLKELWSDFVYDRTKGKRIWILLSVIAAVLSFVLLFFVPTLTLGQCIIVAIFSTLVVATFWYHFTQRYWNSYSPDAIISCGWCVLIAVILWMITTSVFWSLLPLGIMFFILANVNETKIDLISPIFWVGIFAFWFIYIQNNIDAKNLLKSNPKPEVVVLSNFDKYQEVFFIEGQEEYLKFKGFGTWSDAVELELKKGDTVKIVRHPNNSHWVIKISK